MPRLALRRSIDGSVTTRAGGSDAGDPGRPGQGRENTGWWAAHNRRLSKPATGVPSDKRAQRHNTGLCVIAGRGRTIPRWSIVRPGRFPASTAVELRQLRYFLAVRRAASQLHAGRRGAPPRPAGPVGLCRAPRAQVGVPLFVAHDAEGRAHPRGEVPRRRRRGGPAAPPTPWTRCTSRPRGAPAGSRSASRRPGAGGVGVVRDVLRAFAKGSPRRRAGNRRA